MARKIDGPASVGSPRARNRPGRRRRRQLGQLRVVGRRQPRLERGAAQVVARPGRMRHESGHQARGQAEAQRSGVPGDRAHPPRPARRARPGRLAQPPVPVPRRLGIDEARVAAQRPPQPQPADDAPAVDAVAVAGGRREQPRLDRRRSTARPGKTPARRPRCACAGTPSCRCGAAGSEPSAALDGGPARFRFGPIGSLAAKHRHRRFTGGR